MRQLAAHRHLLHGNVNIHKQVDVMDMVRSVPIELYNGKKLQQNLTEIEVEQGDHQTWAGSMMGADKSSCLSG